MGKVIEKTYLNGETALRADQRGMLTFNNPFLVPCTLEQFKDGFRLTFNAAELAAFDMVRDIEEADRYRALANVAQLEALQQEYTFSLAPSNLMLDVNFMPRVIERDMAGEWSFLDAYKALVGTTLMPNYTFDDFLYGGGDLFGKEPFLKKVKDADSVRGLRDTLVEQYYNTKAEKRKNYVKVKKTTTKRNKYLIPILAALSAIGLALTSWFLLYEKPYNDAVLAAYGYYENGQYQNVKDTLAHISVDRMSYKVKYMLARASVHEEPLVKEKRESILSVITLRTKEEYFDFWILLGRDTPDSYERAIDYARRLNDDDLLVTALKKYQAYVVNDTKMTGADKTALLDSLTSEIDKLQKARTDKNSAAIEDSENTEPDPDSDAETDPDADPDAETDSEAESDTESESDSGDTVV